MTKTPICNNSPMKKTELIQLRVTVEDKQLLTLKAKKAGKSLTEYLVSLGVAKSDNEVVQGYESALFALEGVTVGSGCYLLHKGALWLKYSSSRNGRYQYIKLSVFPEPIIQYFRKRPTASKSWIPWPDMAEIANEVEKAFPGLTPRGLWLFSDQVALAVNEGETLEAAIEETLAIAEEGWYETKETKAAMA